MADFSPNVKLKVTGCQETTVIGVQYQQKITQIQQCTCNSASTKVNQTVMGSTTGNPHSSLSPPETLWRLDEKLQKAEKKILPEEMASMVQYFCLSTGSNEKPVTITDLLSALRRHEKIANENVLFLQALLIKCGRDDLADVVGEDVKTVEEKFKCRIDHFGNPQLVEVDGQEYFHLHVTIDVSECTQQYIRNLRHNIAGLLSLPDETHCIVEGCVPVNHMWITFRVPRAACLRLKEYLMSRPSIVAFLAQLQVYHVSFEESVPRRPPVDNDSFEATACAVVDANVAPSLTSCEVDNLVRSINRLCPRLEEMAYALDPAIDQHHLIQSGGTAAAVAGVALGIFGAVGGLFTAGATALLIGVGATMAAAGTITTMVSK